MQQNGIYSNIFKPFTSWILLLQRVKCSSCWTCSYSLQRWQLEWTGHESTASVSAQPHDIGRRFKIIQLPNRRWKFTDFWPTNKHRHAITPIGGCTLLAYTYNLWIACDFFIFLYGLVVWRTPLVWIPAMNHSSQLPRAGDICPHATPPRRL